MYMYVIQILLLFQIYFIISFTVYMYIKHSSHVQDFWSFDCRSSTDLPAFGVDKRVDVDVCW